MVLLFLIFGGDYCMVSIFVLYKLLCKFYCIILLFVDVEIRVVIVFIFFLFLNLLVVFIVIYVIVYIGLLCFCLFDVIWLCWVVVVIVVESFVVVELSRDINFLML